MSKKQAELEISECPYCGDSVKLVDSKMIYGKSYGLSYICNNYPSCDAYVGCHKGTSKPLGVLADKELRDLKIKTHTLFDPLWLSGDMKRKEAYQLLSDLLVIPNKITHIGMFDKDMCKKAIRLITNYWNRLEK